VIRPTIPSRRRNFAGDAAATLLVGAWTGELDRERARKVLRGEDPFDEATVLDEDEQNLPQGGPR
jgi:aerobic C4-dicarboxylate transport protein